MSTYYLQSFLSLFPINQYLNIDQNVQHCFLLDGKTILPIDHNHQLFIPLKTINNNHCSCYQKKYPSHLFNHHDKLKANNNNKHCQVDKEDLCSCSLQSIKIAKQSNCKHYRSNQQINDNKNNIETYLITRIIPSINFTIDSTQINNNQSSKSPSTITIIIKPLISSENHHKHQKDTSLNQKSSLNKRKNSSSSLKSTTKRISTSLSDQILNKTSDKHRLSTFKDIIRSNLPITTPMILNENTSSNILHSKTLFDIYRKKKQYLIKK